MALIIAAAAAQLALAPTAPGCYTAQTPQWTWCAGYAKAGYVCNGDWCSSAECVGSCTQCADFYPNATLDAASARCCAALAPSGGCAGAPLPGDAPFNPPYGFPNNGPGALIVEGPVAFPHGPATWSNDTRAGAYGFTVLAQGGSTDAACPPAPSSGAWVAPSGLVPFSLEAHGEKHFSLCAIGCNVTEVARTGVDPCNAASIAGASAAPSLAGVFANYSCFFGGEGWLKPRGLGVCAFNCSARQLDGSLCSQEDLDADRCDIYCDSRTLPTKAGRRPRGAL
jgi:hypothetical protein